MIIRYQKLLKANFNKCVGQLLLMTKTLFGTNLLCHVVGLVMSVQIVIRVNMGHVNSSYKELSIRYMCVPYATCVDDSQCLSTFTFIYLIDLHLFHCFS